MPAAPEPKGFSIASMVIGISSVALGFTFLVPLVGAILGFIGLSKEPAGKGFAIIGIILNGLFLVGWLLVLLLFGSILAALFAALGSGI